MPRRPAPPAPPPRALRPRPEALGVPPDYFVIKLYQMLQEQREVLTWDPDGGIIIHDRQRLEATLSVYFRHNRFTSFQRQLNNFGFHKKRKPTACLSGTAAQQRKGAAYDHPLLGRSAARGGPPPAPRRAPAPAPRRGLAAPVDRAPALGARAARRRGRVQFAGRRRRDGTAKRKFKRRARGRRGIAHEEREFVRSDLEDRGASASPPRVSDSEGRTSSEERSSSVASSENRNERSSSRDDDGSGSGSDDGHRRQQHPDAPPANRGRLAPKKPAKALPRLAERHARRDERRDPGVVGRRVGVRDPRR